VAVASPVAPTRVVQKRRDHDMTSGAVRIMRSGEPVGHLNSVTTAHRIAHLYLAEWPELAPLTLVDPARRESWTVRLGCCSPLWCDLALHRAGRPAVTTSGLPVRVPGAVALARHGDPVYDPALLQRVVDRLRRLQ
jgi:hypothetical protein